MSETTGVKAKRPVFRNIHVSDIRNYRLPPAGIVSILHRVSGAALFALGIPLVLYLLQLSLTSEASYQRFVEFTDNGLVKLVLLGLFWGFFHHLCAGIRYLLLDIHVGIEKEASDKSAKIVLIAGLVLTAIAALKLFGAL